MACERSQLQANSPSALDFSYCGRDFLKVSANLSTLSGPVRRGDVARVAAEVLEEVDKSCWLDLLEGENDVEEAVGRCISEGVDCVEGENVDAMIKQWAS